MTSMRTRLLAGTVMAIVLSAPLALALGPGLIFTNFQGTLHISQGVPCGAVIEGTTTIAGGRMDIMPTVLRGDAAQFNLTRLEMFFTPFSARFECDGIGATADFREIGARLVSPVTFTGQAIGERRYSFTIPKEQFPIFESVLNNLPVPQPETGYRRPSEDVTGEIDLGRGTAALHIAVASRLRFRVGCAGDSCTIDEELDGRHTTSLTAIVHPPGTDTDGDDVADLSDNCPLVPNSNQSPVPTPVITAPPNVTLGSCQSPNIGTAQAVDVCNARPVFISNNAPAQFTPGAHVVTWMANNGIDRIVTAQQTVTITDGTAPVVSCTAVQPLGGSVRVAAADNCSGPATLKLGSFTLAGNEVIKIQETGRPGVRLIGTVGPDRVRHFQVGKGEAVITATDAAGNVATVVCR